MTVIGRLLAHPLKKGLRAVDARRLPFADFPSTGPLSGANGAVPWIVFQRDRQRFEALFPELATAAIEPCMPFRYLVSGGVSLRSLAPGWTFPMWTMLERLMQPWMESLAMFAFIRLDRR